MSDNAEQSTDIISVRYPFWAEVRQDPDVQRLLAVENPVDANAWMNSRFHFMVSPMKNSQEILALPMDCYSYHDVGPSEGYADLLEAIAEELREQAESKESRNARQTFLAACVVSFDV